MSKCQELHEIAKDSKEKLQQMQRDCLMKIDETCATLTEKHKAEVGKLSLQLTVIPTILALRSCFKVTREYFETACVSMKEYQVSIFQRFL